MLTKMSASAGVKTPGILYRTLYLKLRVEREMIGGVAGDSRKSRKDTRFGKRRRRRMWFCARHLRLGVGRHTHYCLILGGRTGYSGWEVMEAEEKDSGGNDI